LGPNAKILTARNFAYIKDVTDRDTFLILFPVLFYSDFLS